MTKVTVFLIAVAAVIRMAGEASATYCGDGICLPPLEDDFSCPSDCGSPEECEPDECAASVGSCLSSLEGLSDCPLDSDIRPEECIASGGSCHCDDVCVFFGDCCLNACDVCGSCGAICGDGVCSTGEGPSSCPADCVVCGDGTCVPVLEEDASYCPADCA